MALDVIMYQKHLSWKERNPALSTCILEGKGKKSKLNSALLFGNSAFVLLFSQEVLDLCISHVIIRE